MSKKKQTEPPIVLQPVAMDADVYYVQAPKLSEGQILSFKKAWMKLNEETGTIRPLLVVPNELNFQKMPTSLLKDFVKKAETLLQERGEA